jgi:hypothetical protein
MRERASQYGTAMSYPILQEKPGFDLSLFPSEAFFQYFLDFFFVSAAVLGAVGKEFRYRIMDPPSKESKCFVWDLY